MSTAHLMFRGEEMNDDIKTFDLPLVIRPGYSVKPSEFRTVARIEVTLPGWHGVEEAWDTAQNLGPEFGRPPTWTESDNVTLTPFGLAHSQLHKYSLRSSMSGDMVELDGELWLCCPIGWAKVEVINGMYSVVEG